MEKSLSTSKNNSIADFTQISFIDRIEQDVPKTITKKTIYLYILGLIISITISVYILIFLILDEIKNPSTMKMVFFMYELLYFTSTAISIWLLFTLAIYYIELVNVNLNTFTEIILKKMKTRIVNVTSLFVVSLIMKNFENLIIGMSVNSQTSSAHPVNLFIRIQDFLITNFIKMLLCFAIILLLMTVRRILLLGVEYTINRSNYYKIRAKNNQDLEVIFFINSVTGKELFYNSEKWIKNVFKKLSPKRQPLTFETLNYFFDNKDTKKIMDLFDLHKNNCIPEYQFKAVWQNVVQTKENIRTMFSHKDDIPDKLGIFTFFVFLILGIFSIFVIINKQQAFTSHVAIYFSCFLSLTFIFGGVPGELFKSIVLILFIKPFEIGDLIEFNGKKYLVKEIGLMYTTLQHKSLAVAWPNVKIAEQDIINYRITEYIEKTYTFNYNIKIYEKNFYVLREKIRILLKRKAYTFSKKVNIKNLRLLDEQNVEFQITIFVNLHSINYELEVDLFTIELNNLIKDIEQNHISDTKRISTVKEI